MAHNKRISEFASAARQRGYSVDEMHAEGAVCLRLGGGVPSKERIRSDFGAVAFTKSISGILLVDFS
jgi:hypothetical protein